AGVASGAMTPWAHGQSWTMGNGHGRVASADPSTRGRAARARRAVALVPRLRTVDRAARGRADGSDPSHAATGRAAGPSLALRQQRAAGRRAGPRRAAARLQ